MLPLFVSIIALITNSILVYFIVRKGLKNHSRLFFLFLIVSLIVWILFQIPIFYGPNNSALFFIRASMATAIFQTGLFFLFSKTFPDQRISISQKQTKITLFVTTIVSIFCFTPWLFSAVNFTENGPVIKPEFGVSIFALTTFIFIFLGLKRLIKIYRSEKGIVKLQVLYVIVGTAIMFFLFFFLTFMVATMTGNVIFIHIAPLNTLPFTTLTTYAIIRYRFMDIRFAIKRGTAHLVSIVTIIGLYSAVIVFTQQTLVERYELDSTITTIIAVLLIAFSIEPLRKAIIRGVNHVLYSPIEKQRETLSKTLSQSPTAGLSVEEKAAMYAKQLQLTEASAQEIRDVVAKIIGAYLSFLEGGNVQLYIADSGTRTFTLAYGQDRKNTSIHPEDPIHLYLNQYPNILIAKEIPYLLQDEHLLHKKNLSETLDYLEHHNIEIVIPIGTRDRILGIFLIGPKPGSNLYSEEDVVALEQFRRAAAPILSNLITYRSIQTIPIE